MFATHGIPDEILTDNGPPFNGNRFKQFAKETGFNHKKITPLWPQANGQAESAIKTCKMIFKKCLITGQDIHLGLLAHRNTPQKNMTTSPAQRLMGRRLRSTIPVKSSLLKPDGTYFK